MRKMDFQMGIQTVPKMNSSETELMKIGIDVENLWKEILFVERSYGDVLAIL